MKPLSEMTLAEFINQRAQWDLMTAAERAAWYDERDRRQRMLDAAEKLDDALGGLYYLPTVWANDPTGEIATATKQEASDDAKAALAAYQAAKENR